MDEAITNLCRCGIYPRLRRAIRRAAETARGGAPILAAPPPDITPADAAAAVHALTPVHK
jgi:isoquinoline 1-oxidoreductase alpha subunit